MGESRRGGRRRPAECVLCGVEFESRHTGNDVWTKYCSKECGQKSSRKGTKNKNPYPITEAVRQKFIDHPPPSWLGRKLTQEHKDNISKGNTGVPKNFTEEQRKALAENAIKNSPFGMGNFHQGRFNPRNPKKYMGDVNNIIYRSSWELEFFKWCDRRENVIKWASEEFSIPYVSPVDGRIHRYYPDGLVEVDTKTGMKRYIVEIKPARQCVPPVKKDRVTKSYLFEAQTYAVNEAKWKAAKEFAEDNLCEFKILTEIDLGIKPYGTRGLSGKRHTKGRKPRR